MAQAKKSILYAVIGLAVSSLDMGRGVEKVRVANEC
jgi:hypothetical protein